MGKQAQKVAYVVFHGRKRGLYRSWDECQEQVLRFPSAKFQGYTALHEAEAAWNHFKHTACQSSQGGMPTSLIRKVYPLQSFDPNSSKRARTFESIEPPKVPGGAEDPTTRVYNAISFDDDEARRRKRPKMEADFYDEDFDFDQYNEVGEELDLEKEETSVELTAAQKAVVQMAMEGWNIFLTGAAGSGKTTTLKEILRRLRMRYRNINCVQVVAPTGIAALPLNGRTAHSFAGWNLDSFQLPLETLLKNISNRVQEAMTWLEVLIIEEISMVENQFLQRLDSLLQYALRKADPFGGVQVIFVGDFHQIPPVRPFEFCLHCGEEMANRKAEAVCKSDKCENQGMAFKLRDKWAFRAPVWANLRLRNVNLEQIHRQKDAGFQDVLNKIRSGVLLSDHEWKALTTKKDSGGIFPVRLMSRRKEVGIFNRNQLHSLKSEEKVWDARDSARRLRNWREDGFQPCEAQILRELETHKESLKHHRLPTILTLKVGAKVVLLSDLDPRGGLVNGSQGEVVKIVDTKSWSRGNQNGSFVQDGAKIREFKTSQGFLCPVVRFRSGKIVTIQPIVEQCLRGPSYNKYLVSRTQIPLTLAWALSIHKSQGMTLEHVEVSSDNIFESGQLYVGFSRATKLEGLTVTGYSREQLYADSDVLKFYANAPWEDLEALKKTEVQADTSAGFKTEEDLQPSNEPKLEAEFIIKFKTLEDLEPLDQREIPADPIIDFKVEEDLGPLKEPKVLADSIIEFKAREDLKSVHEVTCLG